MTVRPHAIFGWKTPGRGTIALLLTAVLAAPAAAAQSGAEAAAAAAQPEAAAGQVVKVFTVSPAMRYRAIMPPAAPGSERSLEPPALDPAAVRATLGSFAADVPADGGDGVAIAARVLDQFSLTAEKMSVSKQGYLILDLPQQVDAQAGILFNTNSAGSATVNLPIEKDRAYLLDFSVNSWAEGAYEVQTEGGAQSFADPRGEMQHLLLGIRAASSGLSTVTLSRSGSGYYLHSVTVSRLD